MLMFSLLSHNLPETLSPSAMISTYFSFSHYPGPQFLNQDLLFPTSGPLNIHKMFLTVILLSLINLKILCLPFQAQLNIALRSFLDFSLNPNPKQA